MSAFRTLGCSGVALASALVLGYASPSRAARLEDAVEAYNASRYAEAALRFFEVVRTTSDRDARVQSEYYLGHSLFRAGYWLPAYQFYGEVFNAGDSHPFFLQAAEGLLAVSEALDDDTLVPELINRGYSEAFARLPESPLNAINYLIGMISQRRGDYAEAKRFLEVVTDTSPYYFRSRYLLAVMAARSAASGGDYSEAIDLFTRLEAALGGVVLPEAKGPRPSTEQERKLFRLTLLGLARAHYSQGNFATSVGYYEKVPRFSDDWYDAMFESGWAYFQAQRFGRALGMVHSIQSPYFDERYRAESWVLRATTYFQLCHFDRVRRTLDVFFDLYEPVAAALVPWIEADRSDADLVALAAAGHSTFPSEIRLQIFNNRRFQRFLGHVRRVDLELDRATREFPSGEFRAALVGFLEEERVRRVTLTGRLVHEQLKRESAFLEDFLNQARIIKFETADAERKMLEAGKDITKGPRARGPRPVVPNARHQYWGFVGEYWLDELGYHEHSIKDECIPEVFQ